MDAMFAVDDWSGIITCRDQQILLDSLTSIWWRRPERYRAPEGYSPGEKTFLEEEANRGIVGVLDSLSLHHTLWVSRPYHIRRADLKPLQLASAQHLGLRIPRTLVTNDPAAVREFYDECRGEVVLKAVSRGAIEDQARRRFIYTSKVQPEHLSALDGVRITAHLFQERLPKRFDLRVVVIGRQVFAIEIHSQHSEHASLDFRRGYQDLVYKVHSLPDDIKKKALALVRLFELQFSSMDFIVTPQGEYVFLDLNPNGQFYWLQLRLLYHLPLKEAMADLLVFPEDYRL
ncbi:MAG: ATP-dependent carboxylate-amine ligase [Ktedonobacteraceae bacterium]|nr:ATP-dependent carboxylate-amine ligase [Ktedonobacteraceae bacterium]